MSNHRILVVVSIATLIFSAASAAADRLGPDILAKAPKGAADGGHGGQPDAGGASAH
jgi:hypothetical protein